MMTADRPLLEAALSGYEIRLREVNGKIAEIRAELQSPLMQIEMPIRPAETSTGTWRRVIPSLIDQSETETIRTFVPVTRLGEDWPKRKRQMSDAARKRIGAAQKARWKAWRKAKGAK